MAVAVLGMSATMNFAKAQCVNEYGNKEPFAVEFSRLSSYLGLAPYQMEEVLNINDYFVQEQKKRPAVQARAAPRCWPSCTRCPAAKT